MNFLEKHGLLIATAGVGFSWSLQTWAVVAAIFSGISTGVLALVTMYLRIKRKEKDDE